MMLLVASHERAALTSFGITLGNFIYITNEENMNCVTCSHASHSEATCVSALRELCAFWHSGFNSNRYSNLLIRQENGC